MDRLPGARAPGVVSQPCSLDLRRRSVDGQRALRAHVLLVVCAGELALLVGGGFGLGPARRAVHRPDSLLDEVEADLLVRVLAER